METAPGGHAADIFQEVMSKIQRTCQTIIDRHVNILHRTLPAKAANSENVRLSCKGIVDSQSSQSDKHGFIESKFLDLLESPSNMLLQKLAETLARHGHARRFADILYAIDWKPSDSEESRGARSKLLRDTQKVAYKAEQLPVHEVENSVDIRSAKGKGTEAKASIPSSVNYSCKGKDTIRNQMDAVFQKTNDINKDRAITLSMPSVSPSSRSIQNMATSSGAQSDETIQVRTPREDSSATHAQILKRVTSGSCSATSSGPLHNPEAKKRKASPPPCKEVPKKVQKTNEGMRNKKERLQTEKPTTAHKSVESSRKSGFENQHHQTATSVIDLSEDDTEESSASCVSVSSEQNTGRKDSTFSAHSVFISRPCENPRCFACEYMDKTSSVKTTDNNVEAVRSDICCNSSYVVYASVCKKCDKTLLVSSTIQKLGTRLQQRIRRIEANEATESVHFDDGKHSVYLNELKFVGIETASEKDGESETDTSPLKQLEHWWIEKLKTRYPDGLNGFKRKTTAEQQMF